MSKESHVNWDSCIATHKNHLLKFKLVFNLVPLLYYWYEVVLS